MKPKLFVDTNVMVDLLAHRAPFYEAAMQVGCDFIITRNVKDFTLSDIPICTPDEFLNSTVL